MRRVGCALGAGLYVLLLCISSRATLGVHAEECDGKGKEECSSGMKPPPKVVVCIPTTKRRSGREHAANAIASVRSGGGDTKIMVLYDETVQRPEGADFYVPRKAHEFEAPCQFLRWRRNLVLDFVHIMESALEQSDAEMVMWLEDDAVLLPNWREATLNASTYCLTALHPCNCHSCKQEWPFEFNGVGMVAGLFTRSVLAQVLPLIRGMFTLAPLDELVDTACRTQPHLLGPALYHVPPLAEHHGDIAVDTTKGGPLPSVVFLSPAAASTVTLHDSHSTFHVKAKVLGMVYDAEYSWAATINGIPTSEPLTLKTESPRREEDCSDDNAVEIGMTLTMLEEGETEIVLVVMEEESEEKEVVAEATLSFVITYTNAPPEEDGDEEFEAEAEL
mmetsp:Transcript_23848/g.56957  ORF Transcript_23848/g.56957 Transcript_23848/m.56957 type:complete len:391 (-) Transcript_23848:69-1241(-)